MAKFSSTRPGVPDQGTQPSVDDVPVIEGAQIPLPAEEEYFQQAIPEDIQVTPSQPTVDAGGVDTTPLPTVDFEANLAQAAQAIPQGQNIISPDIVSLQTPEVQEQIQKPLYDTEGNEITDINQKISVIAKEQQQTRDGLSRPGVIDYSSYNELSQNFNNIIPESDLGKVQSVARDATGILTEINASVPNASILNAKVDVTEPNQTGLSLLSNAFQVDNKAAVGGYVNAASAVAMEVMSGRINNEVQEELDQDTAIQGTIPAEQDLFEIDLGNVEGIKEDKVAYTNGINYKYFNSRMAGAYKRYMKNLKVAQDQNPAIAQQVNNDIVGDLLGATALESGLFKLIKGNDGETYVIPTGTAIEFSRATRNLINETISERKDIRRPKTPANTDTGWYNSYNKAKEVRNFRISRFQGKAALQEYKSPNKQKGKPEDLTDFTVKVGSVPYSTNNTQVGGLTLLTALVTNGVNVGVDTAEFLGLDDARFNEIAKTAGGGDRGAQAAAQEKRKTINKVNNSIQLYAGVKNSGPEYNYHKEDPSVHRFYPENLAVEMQNNLLNRALGNNPVANPIKVTREDLSSISNMGASSEAYFLKHFKDGGKIKDKRMAIISTMAAIHKNILGKPSESMTWPERVSQMTPAFVAEHGNTGRLIKSAINKLNIINNDGSINEQTLKNFTVSLDQQGQYGQTSIPQLTQDEILAINKWLNNSDPKTFGFALSSYVALAELMDAVQNNTFWNPKVMTDMDMNSAGRTFISMDIGNQDVLERTGIIIEDDNRLKGGPRKLFYDKFSEILNPKFNQREINSLFNESKAKTEYEKKGIASVLFNTLNELSAANPKLYDDLGKKVLLTDDYGKHFAFHEQEAIKFLDKYPAVKDALMPYYNNENDMVVDFNSLYSKTILKTSQSWNKQLPKDIVEVLQFFNRFPEPTLYFGEKAAIGSETYMEVDQGDPITITLPNGTVQYNSKVKVKDPTRKSVEKTVYSAKEGKQIKYVPEYNSYNMNLIGPLLGQYRESATLIDAVNMVNPDKTKTPQWFAIVHDNLIVDGNGFAPYFFAVNSVKDGSAMKVLEYDMMGEFIQDFRRQLKDVMNELKERAQRQGLENASVDIGTNGEFAAIGRKADSLYYRLKDAAEEDFFKKDVMQSELDLYKAIGYVDPDNRSGEFKTFPIKLKALVEKKHKPTRVAYVNGKQQKQTAKDPLSFIQAIMYLRDMDFKMNQFITADGAYTKDTATDNKNKALKRIKSGQDYFLFFT